MKDYKEVTSEILKRRDAHVAYIKKLKKRLIVLLAVFAVVISVGGGAWMIGAGSRNVPDVPPVTDTATESDNGETATESLSQTETVPTDTTETESIMSETQETETTETEPQWTETEPVWTEPVWTEYYETEPLWTEPQWTETEPPVTESVWTEPPETEQKYTGPVPLGSLVTSVYYPETESESETDTEPAETGTTDGGDSVQGSSNSGSGSITGYVTEPTSYELRFGPRTYTFEADGAFFIDADDVPDRYPVYDVGDLTLGQTAGSSLKYLVEMMYGAQAAESVSTDIYNSQRTYDADDIYNTRILMDYDSIPNRNYGYSAPRMILFKTGLSKQTHPTTDSIIAYVTSLPHFEALCSYAGVGEYMLRMESFDVEDRVVYRLKFIPKTDDAIEAEVYQHSNYVSAYVEVYDEEERSEVSLSAVNLPYVLTSYEEVVSYEEAYESVMKVADKYGVREYFEENLVCRWSGASAGNDVRIFYRFYVAFTDENGNVVYCEPEEVGLDQNGEMVSGWPFGHLHMWRVKMY